MLRSSVCVDGSTHGSRGLFNNRMWHFGEALQCCVSTLQLECRKPSDVGRHTVEFHTGSTNGVKWNRWSNCGAPQMPRRVYHFWFFASFQFIRGFFVVVVCFNLQIVRPSLVNKLLKLNQNANNPISNKNKVLQVKTTKLSKDKKSVKKNNGYGQSVSDFFFFFFSPFFIPYYPCAADLPHLFNHSNFSVS